MCLMLYFAHSTILEAAHLGEGIADTVLTVRQTCEDVVDASCDLSGSVKVVAVAHCLVDFFLTLEELINGAGCLSFYSRLSQCASMRMTRDNSHKEKSCQEEEAWNCLHLMQTVSRPVFVASLQLSPYSPC